MSVEASIGVVAAPDVARCSRCTFGTLECTSCVFRGGAHGREINELKGRAHKAETEAESLRATFGEVAKALGLPSVGDAIVQAGMVRAEFDRAHQCAHQLVKARSSEVAKLMSTLTKRNATIGNLRTAKRRAERALYEHQEWSVKRIAELEAKLAGRVSFMVAHVSPTVERVDAGTLMAMEPDGTVKPAEGPSSLVAQISSTESPVPPVRPWSDADGWAAFEKGEHAALKIPEGGLPPIEAPGRVYTASINMPRPRDPADRFGALGPNDEPLWGGEEPSPVEGT
jgi:hypothetical protein